ncbi:MAG: hypothetical protein ACREBU_23950, partial [Nitrososphaera sp.]
MRDPGFPGIRGGQFKANITRLLDNGYLRASLKFIDDRNQFILPLPFQNPDDPDYVPGFSSFGAMSTNEGNHIRVRIPPGELELPLDDGLRTNAYWLTADANFDFSGGWSVQNTAQIMQNDQGWNAIIPFDVVQSGDFVTSFLQDYYGNYYRGVLQAQGTLPRDDQITQNIAPNQKFTIQAANVSHRLFFTNHFGDSGKLPFNTANNLLAPGGEWHVEKPISAFQNQVQLLKTVGKHKFSAGLYFANYTQTNRWFFTDILTDVRDNPRFIDLIVDQAMLQYSFISPTTGQPTTVAAPISNLAATQNGFRRFLSLYRSGSGSTTVFSGVVGGELKLTDRLRADLGFRYENNDFVQTAENQSNFDLDGNPFTY